MHSMGLQSAKQRYFLSKFAFWNPKLKLAFNVVFHTSRVKFCYFCMEYEWSQWKMKKKITFFLDKGLFGSKN